LSVFEYLDHEEDAEPSTRDPAEPLDAPQEPAHVKQPDETKVPPVKPLIKSGYLSDLGNQQK
jgi:hypothetical protein